MRNNLYYLTILKKTTKSYKKSHFQLDIAPQSVNVHRSYTNFIGGFGPQESLR